MYIEIDVERSIATHYRCGRRWPVANAGHKAVSHLVSDERFQRNGLYLWEIINLPGRGMMADFMAHSMHIHGVQFQVVSRQIDLEHEDGGMMCNFLIEESGS